MSLLSSSVLASEYMYITIGSSAANQLLNTIDEMAISLGQARDIQVLKVRKSRQHEISEMMHEDYKRCGGYFAFESKNEAMAEMDNFENLDAGTYGLFADYSIDQQTKATPMVAQANEPRIRKIIEKLSSFKNRYYKSVHGVSSSKWIKSHWESILINRSDAKVEFVEHSWKQPSIVATVTGSTYPEEIIVIGGHADSINQRAFWNKAEAHAPGADDNASGIATISEVMSVLVDSNFKPKRTIKFMAYAAEEVGL
jgi:leucyl aminopeptidase